MGEKNYRPRGAGGTRKGQVGGARRALHLQYTSKAARSQVGDPGIGKAIATAWRLGRDEVVAELLALQALWNKREGIDA